jgi:DDE superfamily endonuclease
MRRRCRVMNIRLRRAVSRHSCTPQNSSRLTALPFHDRQPQSRLARFLPQGAVGRDWWMRLANCNFASHRACHNVTSRCMYVVHFKSGLNPGEAQPENIRLLRLPAYAPELNPQEHVWDEVREKEFPNRVFSDLASVTGQLERGLPQLAADHERLRSITAWPWIVSLILNAN